MDVEMMMAVDALREPLAFLRDVFPWITLVTLLVTVVSVALAEKRRRKLVLGQSAEQERIEGLEHLGVEQKAELLRAAAPLPEAREAYPLPDLPLRLVSALAKVFGFLKIMLLLGAVYGMARIAALPHSERTDDHPVIAGILLAILIALAAAQIIASTRVTRGSTPARRFLIFMAVLELGPMVRQSGLPGSVLWHLILLVMSGYTLWVLLLRRRAQAAVAWEFSPTPAWQKVAILTVGVLVLIQGFASSPHIIMSSTYSFSRVELNKSSSEMGGIKMPIRRIFLQAGDAERDTQTLMQLLRDKLDVPTELMAFEGGVPRTVRPDELYLLVSKTRDQRKPKQPKFMNRGSLRKALMKAAPESAQLFRPQASGDHEIAFMVETPFGNRGFAQGYHHTSIKGFGALQLSYTLTAEFSRGSRKEALGKGADSVAVDLQKLLADRAVKKLLERLPAPLTAEPEPLAAPALECMSKATDLARFYTPKQQVRFYRIMKYAPDAMNAVSNQLVSAGWAHQFQHQFDKGDERITLRGKAEYSYQHPLTHLHLIHSQVRKTTVAKPFRIDFCRQHYADFLSLFYAKSVPRAIFREATQDYLKSPNRSVWELHRVLVNIPDAAEFRALNATALSRFAEALRQEPLNEPTFDLYKQLASELTEGKHDTTVCDQVRALYPKQMIHLSLEADTNGMLRAEQTIEGLGRPCLFTFSQTRNDPSDTEVQLPTYFLVWAEPLTNEKFKVYNATSRGSATSEGTEFDAQYRIIQGVSSGRRGGSSWGALGAGAHRKWVEEGTRRPGALSLIYDISPATDSMTLSVVYNDSTQIVSRAPNGDYILNKEPMPLDAFVAALTRRSLAGEKFGLLVYLEKPARPEFKSLLAALPDPPQWVNYEDPPKGLSAAPK